MTDKNNGAWRKEATFRRTVDRYMEQKVELIKASLCDHKIIF